MEPCTGEDISSLEEDTNLISPSSNGPQEGECHGNDEEAQSILPESLDITRSPSLSSKSGSSIEVQTFSAYSCQQGFAETTESGVISNLKEASDRISTLTDDDSKNCMVGTISSENLIDMDESVNLLNNKNESQEEMEPEASYKMDESSVRLSSLDPESSFEVMEVSLTDNQMKNSVNITASSPTSVTASNLTTSVTSESGKVESPTRKLIQNLDENRRKFESEIGRDIVRERKMRQELEANSSSTGECRFYLSLK